MDELYFPAMKLNNVQVNQPTGREVIRFLDPLSVNLLVHWRFSLFFRSASSARNHSGEKKVLKQQLLTLSCFYSFCFETVPKRDTDFFTTPFEATSRSNLCDQAHKTDTYSHNPHMGFKEWVGSQQECVINIQKAMLMPSLILVSIPAPIPCQLQGHSLLIRTYLAGLCSSVI